MLTSFVSRQTMGATQSKKRRKERKRKRRQQYGCPSSAHFDVPRSVSLDALRSYGVSASSSATAGCPHCGGWSWGHQVARGERRTFSGLLETSGVCHGFHRCLRGQYDDMQSSGPQLRGYDSDDDAARWSYHVSCPACSVGVSEEDMASQASTHAQTLACPGPEHSTMSLNRHAGLRVNSKISQSKSSEFSELLDILRRHEEIRTRHRESRSVPRRENSTSRQQIPRMPQSASIHSAGTTMSSATLPDQSNRVAISSTPPNTVEAPALVPSNTKSPSPPPTQVMDQADKTSVNNNESTSSSAILCPPATAATSTSSSTIGTAITTTSKKPITVLEDEETRLARWEKQKLMTEQFRLLRKHLLAREASLKANKNTVNVSEPLPLSLKGPLDAVEYYLSSQSNSNSSVKSSDLNSSFSNTSSMQSLPNPSPDGSQGAKRGLHVKSSQLSSQSFSARDRESSDRKVANSAARSSSFTFSSSTHRKSVTTASSSVTVEKTTLSSSLQSQSLDVSGCQTQTSQGRSKFTRHGQNFRNLDNHPVLSRLQNEQNSRLERMERKMRCIRASAEQAAERKKFEQIFPARQEVLVEDEKQRMKEAEETLAKLKEENKRKKQMKKALVQEKSQQIVPVAVKAALSSGVCSDCKAQDTRSADDSGEVIPVHVLPGQGADFSSSGSLLGWRRGNNKETKREGREEEEETQPQDTGKKPHWLNSTFSKINMDLGE